MTKKRVWFADSPSPKSVRLPAELDKRRKLTAEDIKKIQKRYKKGESSRAIAVDYAVSKTTILHHVNPFTKEKNNARARERNQEKWKNDLNWKKRKLDSNKRSFKRKKALLPEFRRAVHEYEWRRRARKLKVFKCLLAKDREKF